MSETTDGHTTDGDATGDHAANGHGCPACERRFPDADALRDHRYGVGLGY